MVVWSSDNRVSKVQVLDSRLKTSDFGLDFGLGLWLDNYDLHDIILPSLELEYTIDIMCMCKRFVKI